MVFVRAPQFAMPTLHIFVHFSTWLLVGWWVTCALLCRVTRTLLYRRSRTKNLYTPQRAPLSFIPVLIFQMNYEKVKTKPTQKEERKKKNTSGWQTFCCEASTRSLLLPRLAHFAIKIAAGVCALIVIIVDFALRFNLHGQGENEK